MGYMIYAVEPAVLYTVLMQVIYSLLALAADGRKIPGLMLQAAASMACLAFFGWRAVKEQIRIKKDAPRAWRHYPAAFCYVTAVVMCGAACNYLISMTGLKEASAGYRHVAEAFYGGSLLLEVLTLCVLGPLLEELVYRGFVFWRLCRKWSVKTAAFVSALVFGVMHFNLVQGIYAFVIGLVLAYITGKTGSLITAAAAHMAVNLVSVLWTETDWLDFLNQDGKGQYFVTAACLALFWIFLSYGNQMVRRGSAADN